MTFEAERAAVGPTALLGDCTPARATAQTERKVVQLSTLAEDELKSKPTEQLWVEVLGAILERSLSGEFHAFLALTAEFRSRLLELGYDLKFRRRDAEQESYLKQRVDEDEKRFRSTLDLLDQRSDVLKALFNQSAQACPSFLVYLDACLDIPNASSTLIHRLSELPLAQHLTLDRFDYLFEDSIHARRSLKANQQRLEELTELTCKMPTGTEEGYIVEWGTVEATCETTLSGFWKASHMVYLAERGPEMVWAVVRSIRAASDAGDSHRIFILSPDDEDWSLRAAGGSKDDTTPSLAPAALALVMRAAGYGVMEMPADPKGKSNDADGTVDHHVGVYWNPTPFPQQQVLLNSYRALHGEVVAQDRT